jgi:hypothetical protein
MMARAPSTLLSGMESGKPLAVSVLGMQLSLVYVASSVVSLKLE